MRYAQRVALVYKADKKKQYDYKLGKMTQGGIKTEVVCCNISNVNADLQQRYSDFLAVSSRVIRIKEKLSKEVESVLIDNKKYKVSPIKMHENNNTVLFVSEVASSGD